jgi:hypothetical protein
MFYFLGTELGYGRGMRRFLPALAFVLTPLTGWAQGTAENPQATFRSGVDLVTVSATVRDGKGRLVKSLTKHDFEILDRGDTRALKGALGEVDPFGATSLHDAISAAAERVAVRPMARRAVVVLTDGVDTASKLTPAQVSAKAAAIDVPVYIIAVVSPLDDPGSDHATPGSKRTAPASIGTIEDLSRWTGGALYYSSTSASAFQAARAVIDELRHLYLIAFEPGSDPGWHPIEVRVPQKDFVVRTRGGYVAGPAGVR